MDPRRRPIVIALALAILATVVIVAVALLGPALTRPDDKVDRVERGQPAPDFAGTTLDGAPLALADLRGRPVIVNFWGPSCVPCREEFPLFVAKLDEHADDGLEIVGILMFDPPGPARDFIADHGATWPTVDDPDGTIRTTYRAVARPQTFFIDRDGILRGIQVGQLTEADFERFYASIAGSGTTSLR
ncbi:MAG TPA: redoxin domain-containing protein [Candidatus Limnocylindrales bacterium]